MGKVLSPNRNKLKDEIRRERQKKKEERGLVLELTLELLQICSSVVY